MKAFIYMDENAHIHALAFGAYRMAFWELLYNSPTESYFNDLRSNEDLPFYTIGEWVNMLEEDYEKAIEAYTLSRGLPAIVELEG